jgi:hypothetical protein
LSTGNTRTDATHATPIDTPRADPARSEPIPDLHGATWRKSSHSNGATNCVEVAVLADGRVGVRHSRRPDGAVIVYSRSEWEAFLAGVKAEEFEVGTL